MTTMLLLRMMMMMKVARMQPVHWMAVENSDADCGYRLDRLDS